MRDALAVASPSIEVGDRGIPVEVSELRRGAHALVEEIGDMAGDAFRLRLFFRACAPITIIIMI
jgi:hypothetical protein